MCKIGYNADKMRKIGYNAVFTARIAYSADFFQSQVPRTKRYLLYVKEGLKRWMGKLTMACIDWYLQNFSDDLCLYLDICIILYKCVTSWPLNIIVEWDICGIHAKF